MTRSQYGLEAMGGEAIRGAKPWPMGSDSRAGFQFREPVLHVSTFSVIPTGLEEHIERAIFPCKWTGSCNGGPVSPVGPHVVVEQVRLEKSSPPSPVLIEFPNEMGRDVLAPPIGHKTGRNQLLHIRIHKGDSGLPGAPRFKAFWSERWRTGASGVVVDL